MTRPGWREPLKSRLGGRDCGAGIGAEGFGRCRTRGRRSIRAEVLAAWATTAARRRGEPAAHGRSSRSMRSTYCAAGLSAAPQLGGCFGVVGDVALPDQQRPPSTGGVVAPRQQVHSVLGRQQQSHSRWAPFRHPLPAPLGRRTHVRQLACRSAYLSVCLLPHQVLSCREPAGRASVVAEPDHT